MELKQARKGLGKRFRLRAGHKVSHPLSSLEAQLRLYGSKIGRTQADLQAMVLRESEPSVTAPDEGM